MGMKYSAPDSLAHGGGNWMDKAGTYHLIVTGTDETPVTKDKKPIDGFKVTVQALEGTVKDADGNFTERDKTADLIFFNPKLNQKNEGLFARQKQAAFFIATGLMTEAQLGTEIDIELKDAEGRQVIAVLEEKELPNGKKGVELSFADIWHIDHPRGASFPRCQKSLALIPPAHRRDPKSFPDEEPKSDKGNGKSKPQLPDGDLDNL